MIWFLRMKRWVQTPPSPGYFKLALAVVAVCFAIYLAEYFGVWPEALTLERVPGSGRILR
jgi:hypothetical protein